MSEICQRFFHFFFLFEKHFIVDGPVVLKRSSEYEIVNHGDYRWVGKFTAETMSLLIA